MDEFRLIKADDYHALKAYLNRNEQECSDLYYRFLSEGIVRDPSNRKSGWFYGNFEEGVLKGVFFFANNKIFFCHYESDNILDRVVLLKALKHHQPKIIIGAEEYVRPIWEMIRKSLLDCHYIEGLFMRCNGLNEFSMQKIEGFDIVTDLEEFNINEVLPFFIEVEKAFGRKATMVHNLKERVLKRIKESECIYITSGRTVVAQGMVEFMTDGLAQIGGIYVTPEFRRKGYAEAIVGHLTCQALEKGKSPVLIVEKKNEAAIKLYKKMGYTPLYKHVTLEVSYC